MLAGIYRHFKGNLYELLHLANDSETGEKLVVYKALYGKREIWVRPAKMWEEKVDVEGSLVPRFQYIGDVKTNPIVRFADLNAEVLHRYIKKGDTVVDATLGNGFDALTLARIVGEEGRVFAFDIQECAIENSKKMLKEENVLERITFIRDGHENLEKYIGNEEISAVIFNFGYLPGGDKSITTVSENSKIAFKAALNAIKVGGIVAAMLYSGHDAGRDEKNAIIEIAKNLDNKIFHSDFISAINQKNSPPELLWVTKKGVR